MERGGPKGSERHAPLRKVHGDDRSREPRRREDGRQVGHPPEGKPEESEGRRRVRSVPQGSEPKARGRGERRQAGEEREPQRERVTLRPDDVTGPGGALSHFAHASSVPDDLLKEVATACASRVIH